jgi:hypothetical protein
MSDATTPFRAKRLKKIAFVGRGCVIQGFSLAFIWYYPLGTVIGVVLFIVGSIASTKWICGNCKSRLQSKDVTVCAVCHAELS